jgi:hypothetical protein
MLNTDIDETYSKAMAGTNLAEYWGAASYLRRLLSQQMASSKVEKAAEILGVPTTPTAVIASTTQTNAPAVDFDDPFFCECLDLVHVSLLSCLDSIRI